MILVDYSAIAVATVVINKVNDEDMLRHMILNTLRMYNKKFRDEYGEMILCCDGMNNWRRNYFPQYKANRKKGREESDFDWNKAFAIMDEVREDIKVNFPYKVLRINECEADDIIGTLATNTQEFGNYENVMIVSADGDFKQLQVYENVKQFSPILKKDVVDTNPILNLRIKIIKGDAGDGVPNILSNDNVFVEGIRQTPVSKKKLEAISNDLDDGELLREAVWYRNYQRNETLIDLTKTPDRLKKEIITEYNSQNQTENKGLVLPYLINKNMKMLIESVEEFL
jgi:hypothetical protein